MSTEPSDGSEGEGAGAPADLSHAGAIVDKAIEYMTGQNIGSLAIASALLGGALGMLARSLADDAIIQVLNNAIASVKVVDVRESMRNGGGPACLRLRVAVSEEAHAAIDPRFLLTPANVVHWHRVR